MASSWIQKKNFLFKPISKIGFGTYRISSRIPSHKSSLIYALENGIRLIDTSASYCDGESEELIGEVIKEFTEAKILKREDIQIVSKCGYLSGNTRFENSHCNFPEIVEFNPHTMHCIHPEFIKDQLNQSLLRLKVNYIDCYLLHNPECYLTKHISRFGSSEKEFIDSIRKEMLRRISQSFEFFEKEIKETGFIKSYGISSNSLSIPSTDPHFLPYKELLSLAEQAALKVNGPKSQHHFSVLQFPLNLIETESINNAVDWAYKNNLSVLINRPLNAISDKGSWRLADYPNMTSEFESFSQALIQEYSESKFNKVTDSLQEFEKCVLGQFGMALFEWESYLEGHILPLIRKSAIEDRLDSCNKAFEKLQTWLDLLNAVGKYKSGLHSREFLVNKLNYDIPVNTKLQKYSLEYILKSPGVSCVLLGARNKEYIDDVIDLI